MTNSDVVQQGFEPAVAQGMQRYGDFNGVCLASIAISMKRIADAIGPKDGQDASFLTNLFHTLDDASHNHSQRMSQ